MLLTLLEAVLEYLLITLGLNNCFAMRMLPLANLSSYLHTS
jgi:hypothetical protein